MTPQRDLEKVAEIYGGLLILGSLPNTPAARLGLRYGDILIAVNGVRTTTVADFFRARTLERESMSLEFIRAGQCHALTLELGAATKPKAEDLRAYLQAARETASEDSLPS